MHILFFQYGDFGEAFERFAEGGEETYRDQHSSVDFVAALSERHRVTTVAICNRPHRTELAPGLFSIGIDSATAYSPSRLLALIDGLAPDVVVCRTPHTALLRWTRRRRIPTLPVFADIFRNHGLRRRWQNRRLVAALSSTNVPCVANHSFNASVSVSDVLGYPEKKVIPWDWTHLPTDASPKEPTISPDRVQAFFAGLLVPTKGIGDCLAAASLLRRQGLRLEIDFAGQGEMAHWQAEAERLGVSDQVSFSGRLPHGEVRRRMRAADLVLVPSRHDYAEGLPNTIYEALAAGTPLLISDHPAFAGRLRPDECLTFRAADPQDMAEQISKLARDPALQRQLADNAPAAHDKLYVGCEWRELISCFLADPLDRNGWVASRSLAALREAGRLPRG